jgi:hypothetical protein
MAQPAAVNATHAIINRLMEIPSTRAASFLPGAGQGKSRPALRLQETSQVPECCSACLTETFGVSFQLHETRAVVQSRARAQPAYTMGA